MPQTTLVLRILASKQAPLEIELQTLFGLQVDDVFPSTKASETILSFRIGADQVRDNTPFHIYLEQRKAAGVILEMALTSYVDHKPAISMPVIRVQPGM